jgi:hypothetical protein
MKKNMFGILGIAVLMTIILLIVCTEMMSPALVSVLLAGTLVVVVLGVVAAVRGSRLWLVLSGFGIGLAAFIIFCVVGP